MLVVETVVIEVAGIEARKSVDTYEVEFGFMIGRGRIISLDVVRRASRLILG